jgi:ABC-type Mn2+/Zn2+ transport system permease subunit
MKKNNIFWISYSDLLTSLFFVMLVLFVVTIGYLNNNLETTEKKLNEIKSIETALNHWIQLILVLTSITNVIN